MVDGPTEIDEAVEMMTLVNLLCLEGYGYVVGCSYLKHE